MFSKLIGMQSRRLDQFVRNKSKHHVVVACWVKYMDVHSTKSPGAILNDRGESDYCFANCCFISNSSYIRHSGFINAGVNQRLMPVYDL